MIAMNFEKLKKLLVIYGNENGIFARLGDPLNVRCKISDCYICAKFPNSLVLEADNSGSNQNQPLQISVLEELAKNIKNTIEVFVMVKSSESCFLFNTDSVIMNGSIIEIVASLHPLEDPEVVKKQLGTFTTHKIERIRQNPYYLALHIPDGVDVIGYSNKEERDINFQLIKEIVHESRIRILKGSVIGLEI